MKNIANSFLWGFAKQNFNASKCIVMASIRSAEKKYSNSLSFRILILWDFSLISLPTLRFSEGVFSWQFALLAFFSAKFARPTVFRIPVLFVKADFHSAEFSDWTGNLLFMCKKIALNLNRC